MQTSLNEKGQIGIPEAIREADNLRPGDSFDLQRVAPGQYHLAKRNQATQKTPAMITIDEDGLPLIQGNGRITTQMVQEIEALTP